MEFGSMTVFRTVGPQEFDKKFGVRAHVGVMPITSGSSARHSKRALQWTARAAGQKSAGSKPISAPKQKARMKGYLVLRFIRVPGAGHRQDSSATSARCKGGSRHVPSLSKQQAEVLLGKHRCQCTTKLLNLLARGNASSSSHTRSVIPHSKRLRTLTLATARDQASHGRTLGPTAS